MKRILVTSNCQTPGIVSHLRATLNGWDVTGNTVHVVSSPSGRDKLADELEARDVWLTSLPSAEREKFSRPGLAVVSIPTIKFRAFHPDNIVLLAAEGKAISGVNETSYHSSIIVSGWMQGLSAIETAALFNDQQFHSLGYFDSWAAEVERLRVEFGKTDISFDPVYISAMRIGVFMHSMNHPKIGVLSAIASQASDLIGARAETISDDLIHDPLSHHPNWPVYPPIAARFGAVGTYVWRLNNGVFVNSLSVYIDRCFAVYDKIDLRTAMQPHIAAKHMEMRKVAA